MGKTADLTAVQKAIIDTLKQEGKTQKEISEQIGCSQSAVSRHLSGKSVGRKKCGKKRCTTRRGDRTLRKIVEKDRFQTSGICGSSGQSGVETSRATVHRRVQEMGYRCRIPLLNQKQRQKRLTWATEKQHWTSGILAFPSPQSSSRLWHLDFPNDMQNLLSSEKTQVRRFCRCFWFKSGLTWQPPRPGEWRLHPQAVQLIWRAFGAAQIDLFASPVSLPHTTHCQLFYSLTGGCTGTQLAPGPTQICVSPSEPSRTDTVQSQGGQGAGLASCAVLAQPDLVSGTHVPRDSTSLAHSS
ncbi:hypothetical protein F2P79_023151 [Pimephales promelas]|nr:hypothetical protein F2P79_023151 [Pimephales promelas]